MKKYILILLVACFSIFGCKQNTPIQKPLPESSIATFTYHHEIRMPLTNVEKPPLLILLHGLGSNEKDLFSFAQYLDPRLLVVSPRAPIVVGNNSHSWFHLNRGQDGWTYDIAGVKKESEQLINYIEQLIKTYNVDPSKVYVGGFSQGAIMSLATGLNHSDKIAGIVCLSGRLYPELKPDLNQIKDFNDIDIFVSHGKQDKVLAYNNIADDVKYLEALGLKPSVNYYDAEHTICQDNFRDMVAWISNTLDK